MDSTLQLLLDKGIKNVSIANALGKHQSTMTILKKSPKALPAEQFKLLKKAFPKELRGVKPQQGSVADIPLAKQPSIKSAGSLEGKTKQTKNNQNKTAKGKTSKSKKAIHAADSNASEQFTPAEVKKLKAMLAVFEV